MNGQNKAKQHWFHRARHRTNKHKLGSKMARQAYYRLIVPIKREKRGPKVIAWGVFFGLMVGFTPTVGFQMPLVALIWWLCRMANFHFSLILAIAWSWLSNPATMIPLYYMYYVTGKLLLPNGENGYDFHGFEEYIKANLAAIETFRGSLEFLWGLVQDIGLSIIVGCLPYALILGTVGYWFSLGIARSYQKYRHRHDHD